MRRPEWKRACEAARILVNTLHTPPVPLERIAQQQDVEIYYAPFDGAHSGYARRLGRRYIIGVNSTQSYRRQRFTVAHELGHLLLHDREEFRDLDLVIGYRTKLHPVALPEEVEANCFAAELLMPTYLMEKATETIKQMPLEHGIRVLANQFEVSEQALTIRLRDFVDLLL